MDEDVIRSWIFGALSFAFAFLIVFTPFAQWPIIRVLHIGFIYMDTFIHEVGHSLTSWLFGIPAIPAFDLEYGGGWAVQGARVWLLQVLSLCGLVALVWQGRAIKPLCSALALFTAIVLWAALTKWHEVAILFMGHGFTTVFGGFLLMRGVWDVLLTRPAERWLNVVIGGYLVLAQLQMGWRLSHDEDYRFEYNLQKGTEGFGDFSRITEFNTHWTVEGGGWFLILYTMIVCAFWLYFPRFFIKRDPDFDRSVPL